MSTDRTTKTKKLVSYSGSYVLVPESTKVLQNDHTIDVCRIGGGGAGQVRCGGSGGAMLFVLTFGLRSLETDKLFALPAPVVDACEME